jgi:hypothetical protein
LLEVEDEVWFITVEVLHNFYVNFHFHLPLLFIPGNCGSWVPKQCLVIASFANEWFNGSLAIEEYLRFWKREYKFLKQVKRADFVKLFDTLERNRIIGTEDRSIIQEKILSKNYDKLNICPGFLIKYSWPSQIAISLDKSNKFETDFRDKVKDAFSAFGGI